MCPNTSVLQQFLEGRVSDEQAAELERHLEFCERCATTMNGLHSRDTLLQALCAAPAQARGLESNKATEALCKRLAELPLSRPIAERSTASLPQDRNSPLDAVTQRTPGFPFLALPGQAEALGQLGTYRILKVLGQGGMGMVFQAEDTQLRRLVALKVMKPDIADGAEARGRFLQEARAMAAVKHENIVTIYQVGQEGNVPFLAMEYLEGESLDRWLRAGKRPTVAQILRIGRETAFGLAAAHERGLIHRDIKPANLWLEGANQRVRILDFGLVRAVNEDNGLTGPGQVLGTPAFMALEQARGEKTDTRSDLFSLGAVLYRLATGQLPFQGNTVMAILAALALNDPQPVEQLNPDLPPALARLITEMLSRDPRHRPESALAVARQLEALERETQPVTVPIEAPRGGRWRQVSRAGAASIVLLGCYFGTAPLWRSPTSNPELPSTSLSLSAPAASAPTAPVRQHPDGWPLRQAFNLSVEPLGGRQQDGLVVLHPRERIGLRVKAERKCYVALFYRDDQGHTTMLFPNAEDKQQLLEAGQVRELPRARDGKPGIEATEPSKETEYLYLVASTEPWKPPEGNRGAGSPYVNYETREQRAKLESGLRGLGLAAEGAKGTASLISEEVIPLRVEP